MAVAAMNGTLLATSLALFGLTLFAGLLVWRRFLDTARSSSIELARTLGGQLFDAAPVALFQMQSNHSVTRMNRAFKALLGVESDTFNLLDTLHPEDASSVITVMQELEAGYGESAICESRLRNRHGHLLWVQLQITRSHDALNGANYFLIAAIDIGERKRAEQLIRSEEEKLKVLVNQLPVAVWMMSPSRDLLFINDAFEVFTGRSKEEIYADPNSLSELIHPDDVERAAQLRSRSEKSGGYEVNYRVLRDDGEMRYIREQGNGIYDERGNQLYQVCSATDISGEMIVRDELHELNSRLREANLRLRESIRMDNLTGCLNRAALLDEADKALQLEQRYRRSSALVFFDLNDFKAVNDNFGHHVGDRCLLAFAEQIKARLRTTDELGRYGGDEFVALLRETDAEQAQQLLSTLVPIVIEDDHGGSIILRFSAGVACSNDAGIYTIDDWLRAADVQMYRQKLRCAPRGL